MLAYYLTDAAAIGPCIMIRDNVVCIVVDMLPLRGE